APDGSEASLSGTGGQTQFFGSGFPARVWTAFMQGALEGTPVIDFVPPEDLPSGGGASPTASATPEPTSESPTPEPTSESPTPEPTPETPTPEPTSEPPTPEPTDVAPSPPAEAAPSAAP
nr:hypothetical protein [Candidatus Nanopelagicales bacterium]